MKIQRGIVEYKGRNDIDCMYAVTDDKKIYYFLDSKDEHKYSNGSRLASTVLLEAVDEDAPKSHVGILGENGEELVTFSHREIVPINDENPEILLAKLADPVTPCVVEANKAKNDPSLATKLVSNQALIKDKMKSKMGNDGVFLFHNQFLEATVYDINGRNLAGDGYYSFIGFSKGKLYFSLNTADSEIIETSLFPIDENATDSSINVEKSVIATDVVENALESSNDLDVPVVDQNLPSEDETVASSEKKSAEADNINNDDDLVTESISDSDIIASSEDEKTIKEDLSDSDNKDDDLVFDFDEINDESEIDTSSNNLDQDYVDKDDSTENNDLLTNTSDNSDSFDVELFDSKNENIDDIMIDTTDSYDSNYYEVNDSYQNDHIFDKSSIDNNIGDVASFISRLMEKHKDVLLVNKKLVQTNQTLKNNLKKATDSKNDILRKNSMMEQKVEMQDQKLKKQEQKMMSLMDRLQDLESKNQEMINRINSYQKELKNYNTQKAELDKVLKDAKEFLKDDSYHFSDDDYNYVA